MDQRKIVVSIDFGTTFSGLAWAETSRADYQYVIDTWPADNSTTTSPKVPTELRAIAGGFQWGFQIPNTAKRNKYFKLKLDDPGTATTDSRPPEELTQLYLSYLYKHLISTLEQRLSSSVIRSTPIDFVLTVPAIWSSAAKQKTEVAARKAGFKGSSKIYLVSEPEAAAIYTLSNLISPTLQVGKTFVVCDAGGGTVDLISYKIVRLHPQLHVEEATGGTGGKCGSSMLNKRFRRYLKQKFGEAYFNDDRLAEALNIFETFKKSFTPGGEPLTLRIEMPNNERLGVRRGRHTIRQNEMLSEIFDPIIKDIIGLINDQIGVTQATVSAVLLVGGFGQSKYLETRIKTAIPSSIQVLRPANGWTAVVQGAAMMGLSRVNDSLAKVHVLARTARRHYGTELTAKFDPKCDDASKKFWYKKWKTYAIRRMFWFINKGESYPENRPSAIKYSAHIPFMRGEHPGTLFEVFANDADEHAPRNKNSNTKRIAKLELNLNQLAFFDKLTSKKKRMGGHWYFCFDGVIQASYGPALVTYTLNLNGKTHDIINVNYD